MSCDNVNSYFEKESDRLTGEIAHKSRVTSPWSALMPKGKWEDGIGHTMTQVIGQRTAPTVGEGAGWTTIAHSSGGTAAANCRPTAAVLSSRTSTKTAQLAEYVLKSDPLCVTDIRATYQSRRQVQMVRDNFVANVVDIWNIKDREEYVGAIPDANKLVFYGAELVGGSSGDFDEANAPDSPITQDALDMVRWQIIQDGGSDGSYSMIDGEPVLACIMSAEQKRALIKGDASVREDFRMGDPGALLKPFGVRGSYAGFYHIADIKAPRWDLTVGGWVEVPYWVTSEDLGDAGLVVNPDYRNAGYEDVIVFHKKVVTRLMMGPVSNLGADTSWTPWNYAGEVKWVNEYDKECNEFGDNGYWAARLRAAYMQTHPELGYAIRVKRCTTLTNTTCPTS